MTTATSTHGVDEFLRLLALQRDGDAFVTEPGGASPAGVMYGGMLAAHVLMVGAAQTELPLPQSLQLLFLRPGDASTPVRYHTEMLRDGRSTATFRITGAQAAGPVVDGTVSFTAARTGIDHQPDPMPAAPAPEAMVPSWQEMGGAALHPCWTHNPLELRGVVPFPTRAAGKRFVVQRWARPLAPLPADPRVHAAALVHASDLMAAPLAKYYDRLGKQASLDHTVWFHGTPRCTDWVLFHTESPRAAEGRALLASGVYQADGTRCMTVTQEAIVRD